MPPQLHDELMKRQLRTLQEAISVPNGRLMDRTHLPPLAPVRQPFEGEDSYFKSHPEVKAMATEDEAVIFNPYVPMSEADKHALRINESMRIAMDRQHYQAQSPLTEAQARTIAGWGGPYASDTSLAKKTVLGRIAAHDMSLAPYSAEQQAEAQAFMDAPPPSQPSPVASHLIRTQLLKHR